MDTPDVVVLVPGFLGFSRFGGFYYFADRLVAVLRANLEEQVGYTVPVVPCTILPTHALAERQRGLLDYLGTLCSKLSGVERIHLVGHSTGGVDAQLLACTTAIDGKAWSKEDAKVIKRIGSVVTISAPHYGTGLAESRLARWGENPLLHPTALLPEAATLLRLLLLVPRDLAAVAGIGLAAPNDVLRFLWQVARHRELIADLRPARMEKLRARLEPEPAVPLTCFVTGTVPRDDGDRPSDPFFQDLYGLTRDGVASASPVVARCERLLRHALRSRPQLVIRSATSRIPAPIDLGLNDGVVNSARQVVDPGDASQLGGFVVADHADVLGHYDRQDALIDGREYNAGLFHSGAGFGDDEFFELHRRVGAAILAAIREADRPAEGGEENWADRFEEIVELSTRRSSQPASEEAPSARTPPRSGTPD